jgi:hypothetical protein
MSGSLSGMVALGNACADAIGAIGEANRAEAHLHVVSEMRADYDKIESTNAANFAEKHALRVALAKLDPKHPLVVNKVLQEKIKSAGRRALDITSSWNAVAEAGQTFKY